MIQYTETDPDNKPMPIMTVTFCHASIHEKVNDKEKVFHSVRTAPHGYSFMFKQCFLNADFQGAQFARD